MIAAAALFALALQGASAREPGPVVLLGARVALEAVPELKTAAKRLELRLRTNEPEPLAVGVLDPKARFAADAPELAKAVLASERIELGAGSLADWLDVLYPRRHDSALVTALIEAHRTGATLVGRGESACLVSAAAVAPNAAAMRASSSDPHDARLPIAVWPLALQPWALLDEEQRAGGSFERLAFVLEREKLPLGVFLAADGALVVRRGEETLHARGPGTSLVLDLRGARRGSGRISGARLSLLGDGDRWIAPRRDAVLADEIPSSGKAGAAPVQRRKSALELASLADALARLSSDAASVRVEGEDGSRIELVFDELTTVATDAAGHRRWAEARADVSWNAAAKH